MHFKKLTGGLGAIIAALTVLITTSPSAAFSSFHLGNSFTLDSTVNRLEEIGSHWGWESGYHIRSGSTLQQIWNDPNPTPSGSRIRNPTYGFYENALTNYAWDAVTFQPYSGASLTEDVASIKNYINLIETEQPGSSPKYYIYQTWTPRGSYTTWDDPLTPAQQTTYTAKRDYAPLLIDALENDPDLAGIEFGLIPAGEVLYQLQVDAANGEIVGLTDPNDVYRDHTHMSYHYGRFAALMTMYATLAGEDPTGMDVLPLTGMIADFDDGIQTHIQSTVWEVIQNEPLAFAAIPEPMTALLLLAGGALLVGRRYR